MGKQRDISHLIGQQIEGSMLTIDCRAGHDAGRHPLVDATCICGEKALGVRLENVIKLNTISCGHRGFETYCENVNGIAATLTPAQLGACFKATIRNDCGNLDYYWGVITAGYYRHCDHLRNLPEAVMQDIRMRVLAAQDYEIIAGPHHMMSIEISWLAKHVIRPAEAAKATRDEGDIRADLANEGLVLHVNDSLSDMIDMALGSIDDVRMKMRGRDSFFAREWSDAKKLPKRRPILWRTLEFIEVLGNYQKLSKTNREDIRWVRGIVANTREERRFRARRAGREARHLRDAVADEQNAEIEAYRQREFETNSAACDEYEYQIAA